MTSLPSTPVVPVRAIFPATEPVEMSGLTMYHATPARFPPVIVTAVSSAPHTLPFAYMTCCMRVSFESSLDTTSLPGAPTRRRQQPTPAIVEVVVSLMQRPCGVAVVGATPDPG